MTETEVLNSPFDIETHKQIFHGYLEVMVAPDGTIAYAVPSHQEYLIEKAVQRHNCTREELYSLCPEEYYVPVWEKYVYAPMMTTQQRTALKKLKMAGLYKGAIPQEK